MKIINTTISIGLALNSALGVALLMRIPIFPYSRALTGTLAIVAGMAIVPTIKELRAQFSSKAYQE